jgi:hypothetical protein
LVASSGNALLGRLAQRLHEVALPAELNLGADTQRGRQHHPFQKRPGVEIDLRHAPTLLAANGLDICEGHPAAEPRQLISSEVLTPRRYGHVAWCQISSISDSIKSGYCVTEKDVTEWGLVPDPPEWLIRLFTRSLVDADHRAFENVSDTRTR